MYLTLTEPFPVASLACIALISLEWLHATLFPLDIVLLESGSTSSLFCVVGSSPWPAGGGGRGGGGGGGAGGGSEVWNRIYIIAPVKKFGPSETEYKFSLKTNMAEKADTWKDDEFSLGFKFSRVQISREGFYELF